MGKIIQHSVFKYNHAINGNRINSRDGSFKLQKDTEPDQREKETIIRKILNSGKLCHGENRFIRYGRFHVYKNTTHIEFTGNEGSGIKQYQPRGVNEDYSTAYHWYGSMTKDEFLYLERNNAMPVQESYGGICANAKYSIGYCDGTDNSDTHVVEYAMSINGAEFKKTLFEHYESKGLSKLKTALEPKGEAAGGSFGLGRKGTYTANNHGAGAENVVREVFNEMLKDGRITYKLVYIKFKLSDFR
ncbi:hypothetical protein [Chitinophaga pinensis]|uniref:Uncharacterized protein n=1 Tax=Chitinophaga pinensis (strain ATCC 43595 / DSM 2588 / LMG 13176 / NBRC 15968 / NCIMB 11800 / UQM 2034) TaxID=485918 RepID=A0A979GX34_CHIPD|nr:hypothetical protein [Chitinophaga pinensis]ACU62299.1 hypothetical protein Cpin_4865 [Chitinophaga pinensis DSM 2588]